MLLRKQEETRHVVFLLDIAGICCQLISGEDEVKCFLDFSGLSSQALQLFCTMYRQVFSLDISALPSSPKGDLFVGIAWQLMTGWFKGLGLCLRPITSISLTGKMCFPSVSYFFYILNRTEGTLAEADNVTLSESHL